MVVERHAEGLAGFVDFLRHREVGRGGLGIAGRMIVDDDQRGCVKRQAPPQHLPGIDRDMVDRADGEAFIGDEPVLPVETEDMEALHLTPDGEGAIVQNRLPGGQDRVLVQVAQQDLAGLVDDRLLLGRKLEGLRLDGGFSLMSRHW